MIELLYSSALCASDAAELAVSRNAWREADAGRTERFALAIVMLPEFQFGAVRRLASRLRDRPRRFNAQRGSICGTGLNDIYTMFQQVDCLPTCGRLAMEWDALDFGSPDGRFLGLRMSCTRRDIHLDIEVLYRPRTDRECDGSLPVIEKPGRTSMAR